MLHHPKLKKLQDHERNFLIKQILEYVTKKPFIKIISESYELSEKEIAEVQDILHRHLDNYEPLAYIFSNVSFLNLELDIKPPVLIPRPETEEWVKEFIDQLQKLKYTDLCFADIGTGSGCIAIALAKNFPNSKVYAVDISDDALALAKQNAEKNGIKNIIFLKSDMLEKVDKVDFILSNPPYISEAEYQNLDFSVKNWEDKNALVAKNDGYELIEKLLVESPAKLSQKKEFVDLPRILIEIGYNQGKALREKYPNLQVKKDSCSKDRVIQLL